MIVDNKLIFGNNTLLLTNHRKDCILTISSMNKPIPKCLRPSKNNLESAGIKEEKSVQIQLDKIIYIKLLNRKINKMISLKSLSFEYAGYIWDFSNCINNDSLGVVLDIMIICTNKLLREEKMKHEKIRG